MDVYDEITYVHKPEPISELIKHLTKHDWGLVGNLTPTPEWDIAFPNKLFEYLAASVPVVAINAKECSKFIKKHGVGMTVKSLDELKDRWSEHRKCRENVIKKRQKFTMDNNIKPLEELYASLT
jgi:hypothetical protein